MDKVLVTGGKKLNGKIRISGAKNAILPIMAATLLTEEKCIIQDVPPLRDVFSMIRLLRSLGAKVSYDNQTLEIEASDPIKSVAEYDFVRTMRASVCVLGPLLARLNEATVSMPGGCVIGARPIDLHLKGIQNLGAKVEIESGFVRAKAKKLEGVDMFLGGNFGSSVLATANIMMAATLATGTTTIENAACEPEMQDLADFLNKMGAKITGAGSPFVQIRGVKKLKGTKHRVIPDRIEAGTFMIAAMMTGGKLTLNNVRPEHNGFLIDKLKSLGAKITKTKKSLSIEKGSPLKPIEVTTYPYPGFPTDLQAQMMAMMTVTPGISVVTEKIYPNRFMHVSELNRMGAKIFLEGSSGIINGVPSLSGAPVMASDLRASAALILAGLVAKGTTEVNRVYHLDRGYFQIEKKLAQVGADIKRVDEYQTKLSS